MTPARLDSLAQEPTRPRVTDADHVRTRAHRELRDSSQELDTPGRQPTLVRGPVIQEPDHAMGRLGRIHGLHHIEHFSGEAASTDDDQPADISRMSHPAMVGRSASRAPQRRSGGGRSPFSSQASSWRPTLVLGG